ncbi:MAG: SWIM zinc finger family protein [Paracoccaceae bacterium]
MLDIVEIAIGDQVTFVSQRTSLKHPYSGVQITGYFRIQPGLEQVARRNMAEMPQNCREIADNLCKLSGKWYLNDRQFRARMTITLQSVQAIAPDQASLNAANKLLKPAKWPLREIDEGAGLVWGECQGSGSNPYRTVFDKNDQGYKCTCPSRKFPCKHALALMWMYADTPSEFNPGTTPEWVTDWLGRRRNTGGETTKPETSTKGKSLTTAQMGEPEKPKDPKAEARAKAAAIKRAADTETALMGAMDDLETWIDDQLRTGLFGLMGDLTPRCRAIAARMVDGKAAALAGRLDELPAELMTLPGDERLDALIGQLGKLVILARAFRADPKNPAVRRSVATSEKREDIVTDPDALKVKARWEVAGERIKTRRDGLVSQATWLLNLDAGDFALLLDFFPASVGKRTSAFAPGDQFEGEVIYYPAEAPLRAVVNERSPLTKRTDWPDAGAAMTEIVGKRETLAPWETVSALLLPTGHILSDGSGKPWWQSRDGSALPIDTAPVDPVYGMELMQTAALWNGTRLSLLSAHTDWGRIAFDA